MKISYRLLPLAILAVASAAANADQFQLTITNTGPQPLSPLFYAAGDTNFDIFSLGSSASAGIKNIAESGRTVEMLGIASAAGSSVGTYGVLGASPLLPGQTRTVTFNADAAHPYFSFAAMLGKTNDGFIGESVSSLGWKLFDGSGATSRTLDIYGTRAWDAGTELNTQNAADLGFLGGSGNPAENPANAFVRVHGGVIPGVGDSWQQMPAWDNTTQLAQVKVQAVPEPTSMAALGLGAIAMIRRRKKSA